MKTISIKKDTKVSHSHLSSEIRFKSKPLLATNIKLVLKTSTFHFVLSCFGFSVSDVVEIIQWLSLFRICLKFLKVSISLSFYTVNQFSSIYAKIIALCQYNILFPAPLYFLHACPTWINIYIFSPMENCYLKL